MMMMSVTRLRLSPIYSAYNTVCHESATTTLHNGVPAGRWNHPLLMADMRRRTSGPRQRCRISSTQSTLGSGASEDRIAACSRAQWGRTTYVHCRRFCDEWIICAKHRMLRHHSLLLTLDLVQANSRHFTAKLLYSPSSRPVRVPPHPLIFPPFQTP